MGVYVDQRPYVSSSSRRFASSPRAFADSTLESSPRIASSADSTWSVRSDSSKLSSSTTPSSSSTSSSPSTVGLRLDILTSSRRLRSLQYPGSSQCPGHDNLGRFGDGGECFADHLERAPDHSGLMSERDEVVRRPLEQDLSPGALRRHRLRYHIISVLEEAHLGNTGNTHDQIGML